MEARVAESGGSSLYETVVDERLLEDPFFYGHRWVEVETADGVDWEQVPLTEDDLLDPQEGDKVSEHTLHHQVVRWIEVMLEVLYANRGLVDVLVGGNLKILWRQQPGKKRLRRPAPDVCIIPQVKDPHAYRKSFDEAKEGTRPIFVLEVTSEATDNTDKNRKPRVYERAGVEEYFLLDTLAKPWTLTGRRLYPKTGRYRKIQPDDDGRVLAETLEVRWGIGEDGASVVLVDERTGEELMDSLALDKARQAAEKAQKAAEAEIERLKALLAKRS